MLLRHRGMLTFVTLLVLASVTVGAGLALRTGKVDPATASRDRVFRYLVLADLSAEPLEVQTAWVDRLQQELSGDFSPGTGGVKLSQGYRDRLGRNIETLQAVWFKTRCAQHAELPPAEREAFVLAQLEVVGAWAKVGSLVDAAPVAPEVATRHLLDRIDHWTSAATGQERENMIAAVIDGTVCWLSTTDLSQQPPVVRRELAERLALELDRGAKADVGAIVTDGGRHQRMTQNAAQLVEAYVHVLAEKFAAVPMNDRPAFLDDHLAKVEKWGVERYLTNPNAAAALSPLDRQAQAALALVAHAKGWVEHAPPEKRGEVQTFVTALQKRMVWRQLPAWMRGKS